MLVPGNGQVFSKYASNNMWWLVDQFLPFAIAPLSMGRNVLPLLERLATDIPPTTGSEPHAACQIMFDSILH